MATTTAPYASNYNKYSDPKSNYLTTSVARMNNLSTTLLPHKSKSNYELDALQTSQPVNHFYECSHSSSSNTNTKQNSSIHNENEATVIESGKLKKESKSETDTIESSHSDSDDAKGPVFPADCYGSRLNEDVLLSHEEIQNRKYIYDRRESALKGSLNDMQGWVRSLKVIEPKKNKLHYELKLQNSYTLKEFSVF
jgi:hypothetical protein